MMLITFGIHLYEICTKKYSLFVWYIFKTAAIKKKKVTMDSKHTLVQISFIPLAKWTIYASIL